MRLQARRYSIALASAALAGCGRVDVEVHDTPGVDASSTECGAASCGASPPQCSLLEQTLLIDGGSTYYIPSSTGFSYTAVDLAAGGGNVFYEVQYNVGSRTLYPLRRFSVRGGPYTEVTLPSLVQDAGGYAEYGVTATRELLVVQAESGLVAGPLDGGAISTILNQNNALTAGWTFDDTNVYWPSDHGIQATPMDGGSTRLVTSQGGLNGPPLGRLAAVAWDCFIFFTGSNISTGSISSVPIDGGSPATLVPNEPGLYFVAPCERDLCWLSDAGLTRMSQGAAPVVVNPSVPPLTFLATDGLSLYGTVFPGPAPMLAFNLVRLPLDGGPQVQLFSGASPGGPLAVDDHCVYWMDVVGIWGAPK